MEIVILTWLSQAFVYLWSLWYVQFITYHVLFNVSVALLTSIVSAQFRLARVIEFLYRKLLPYIGLLAITEAFGGAIGLAALTPVVILLIETRLAADLMENLKTLGVPIPDIIMKKLGIDTTEE